MSFILQVVRPDNLQNWIRVNAPGSFKATAGDSWRAYLSANGGTGKTLYDLEHSFLTAAAVATGPDHDRWNTKLTATTGKNGSEKARNFYK